MLRKVEKDSFKALNMKEPLTYCMIGDGFYIFGHNIFYSFSYILHACL